MAGGNWGQRYLPGLNHLYATRGFGGALVFRGLKHPDRDRETPRGAPLPHHPAYGSVQGGSVSHSSLRAL
jgi:hypothetical protein